MSSTDSPPIADPLPQLPTSLIVRYGYLNELAELPYDGNVRPLCGAKVVIRSRRGTELAHVLTTTCPDTGCAVSVSREQVREYIQNSGGAEFPFTSEGRVIRIATRDDLRQQDDLDGQKPQYLAACRQMVRELELPMRLVDVELILGGEMATFYFLSEHRVDFRTLVKQLAARFHTRIQMHQVGSRDEARIAADYETCGQYCCCKQFLKVLRPVSMGSAKMQKATLDPSKISGRCGRLKCCLRYEEATYDELRKRLPRVGARVRTPDGEGTIEETMILTQLVKVRLDEGRIVALAVEELLDRDAPDAPRPPRPKKPEPRAASEAQVEPARQADGDTDPVEVPKPEAQRQRPRRGDRPSRGRPSRREAGGNGQPASKAPEASSQASPQPPAASEQPPEQLPREGGQQPAQGMGSLGRSRRRRRGRGRSGRGPNPTPPAEN